MRKGWLNFLIDLPSSFLPLPLLTEVKLEVEVRMREALKNRQEGVGQK